MHLILASESPRRKELLESCGFSVICKKHNIDESEYVDSEPEILVERLAIAKARSIQCLEGDIVVGGDTIVCLEDQILGKPQSYLHARSMLEKLSGKSHKVVSGYAITRGDKDIVGSCVSRVTFRDLKPETIDWYLAQNESLDKAGGYGAQGLGSFLIEDIKGSLTNVIGMPLKETCEAIQKVSDAWLKG